MPGSAMGEAVTQELEWALMLSPEHASVGSWRRDLNVGMPTHDSWGPQRSLNCYAKLLPLSANFVVRKVFSRLPVSY